MIYSNIPATPAKGFAPIPGRAGTGGGAFRAWRPPSSRRSNSTVGPSGTTANRKTFKMFS